MQIYQQKEVKMNTLSPILRIIIFVVLGILASWIIFSQIEQFSSFGVAIVLAATGTGILWLVDRFLLYGYDTIDELKKGNIAVGMALIAYAILISSCILASFLVWR